MSLIAGPRGPFGYDLFVRFRHQRTLNCRRFFVRSLQLLVQCQRCLFSMRLNGEGTPTHEEPLKLCLEKHFLKETSSQDIVEVLAGEESSC
jgi:hypothetical protein